MTEMMLTQASFRNNPDLWNMPRGFGSEEACPRPPTTVLEQFDKEFVTEVVGFPAENASCFLMGPSIWETLREQLQGLSPEQQIRLIECETQLRISRIVLFLQQTPAVGDEAGGRQGRNHPSQRKGRNKSEAE